MAQAEEGVFGYGQAGGVFNRKENKPTLKEGKVKDDFKYLHQNDRRPMTHFITGKRDSEQKIEREVAPDRDWSRNAFQYISQLSEGYVPSSKDTWLSKTPPDIVVARHTKGYRSFVDTSLGGNFPINVDFAFTEFADIPMERKWDAYGSGMGQYYFDTIEDNAHDIHLQFGVQKFNSGLSFFASWFDYRAYSLATHGRTPSILYDLGQVAGLAMGFMAPQLLMVGWLVKLFSLVGGGRFWYVSPAMPVYWTAVTNIFNEITGNMGMTMGSSALDVTSAENFSNAGMEERSYIKELHRLMPGIYEQAWGSNEEGFNIDIRRMVTRTQALENQLNEALQRSIAKGTGFVDGGSENGHNTDKLIELYDKAFNQLTGSSNSQYGTRQTYNGSSPNKSGVRAYLQEYLKTKAGSGEKAEKIKGLTLQEITEGKALHDNDPDSMDEIYGQKLEKMNNLEALANSEDGDIFGLLKKELRDGSSWLTLRVNGHDSVSESFSNSSEESTIASAINGMVQQNRQLAFNLMGGAVLGDAVQSVIQGAKDFIAGSANSLGFGGLTGFLFGGRVDIPRTYSGSSVSLPRRSYTIKCRPPYGHKIALAQTQYVLIACALAMVLPLSQGRNAYGTPFYVQVFDRGRCVIRNGLVSSLSITRGTGGVPWTREGLPLGIDISFEIENLDPIMALPVNTMSFIDSVNPGQIIDRVMSGHEGAFADYMSTLAGLSLPDMVYMGHNIRRNWYKFVRQWSSVWDRDHFIQNIGHSAPARVISGLFQGTSRR